MRGLASNCVRWSKLRCSLIVDRCSLNRCSLIVVRCSFPSVWALVVSLAPFCETIKNEAQPFWRRKGKLRRARTTNNEKPNARKRTTNNNQQTTKSQTLGNEQLSTNNKQRKTNRSETNNYQLSTINYQLSTKEQWKIILQTRNSRTTYAKT